MKANDETKFDEKNVSRKLGERARASGRRNVQPSCRIAKRTRDARSYRDDALLTHLIPCAREDEERERERQRERELFIGRLILEAELRGWRARLASPV